MLIPLIVVPALRLKVIGRERLQEEVMPPVGQTLKLPKFTDVVEEVTVCA
jgi:hypothetical protein